MHQQDIKHPHTIFKSAYYLGDKLLSLFVNYNSESNPNSISFVIKKGAYSFIYNLTTEEKLPFIRTLLRQLSQDELDKIVLESKLDKGA